VQAPRHLRNTSKVGSQGLFQNC